MALRAADEAGHWAPSLTSGQSRMKFLTAKASGEKTFTAESQCSTSGSHCHCDRECFPAMIPGDLSLIYVSAVVPTVPINAPCSWR
eukprot:4654755-Pyramimonas_sp.AAC.1